MWRIFAALLFCLVAAVTATADAPRRVALVIGNGAYANVPRLANPTADAAGIAQALGDVGFEVVQGIDLPRADLLDRIRVFAQKSDKADIALVYYAGHGVQVDNENWILPVDAHLKDKFSLEFEAISVSSVIKLTSGAVSRVFILDACRNNPFAELLRSNSRAVAERGLARINVTDNGILIAFATSPGSISVDSVVGSEGHSPFAKALIDNLRMPGLEVHQLFTRVRQHVYAVTNGAQIPWENSSLFNDVFLAGEAAPRVSALEAEYTDWQKLETSNDVKDLEDYLRRYPSGKFSPLTRLRIDTLRQPGQTPAALAAARDCGNCPELVAIPAGAFMLGGSADDKEKNENEGPGKRTEVPGFELGRYTVTFAEWDACGAMLESW